jgi:hypothetical protein
LVESLNSAKPESGGKAEEMQNKDRSAKSIECSGNAAKSVGLLLVTTCLLVTSIVVAQDSTKTAQNSNQTSTRNYKNPGTAGSHVNPAPRTGANDRSTNTFYNYAAPPQRTYDGSKPKPTPAPPVQTRPSGANNGSTASKAD